MFKRLFTNKVVHAQVGPPGRGELNPSSPTWLFILEWSRQELAKARASNDSLSKDAVQTAALRGRIGVLKELVALPEKGQKEALLKLRIAGKENVDPTFAGY